MNLGPFDPELCTGPLILPDPTNRTSKLPSRQEPRKLNRTETTAVRIAMVVLDLRLLFSCLAKLVAVSGISGPMDNPEWLILCWIRDCEDMQVALLPQFSLLGACTAYRPKTQPGESLMFMSLGAGDHASTQSNRHLCRRCKNPPSL